MNFNIDNIIRPNIKKLVPYTTARHEYTGTAEIYLDANENPFGTDWTGTTTPDWIQQLNRYPDPMQIKLKEKLSSIKGVPTQNIFLGNGSDEAIDVLLRMVGEPGKDNILLFTPTYGMYAICANMNDVTVKEIPLNKAFQPDLELVLAALDQNTKIIFLCSPNNPTGNNIDPATIEFLLTHFSGLVVIDEAYINYSSQKSWIPELLHYGNLIILQTLSKAWGLAGLRVGMAFASEAIISYMNKVKYPYNINVATQELALQALEKTTSINQQTIELIKERKWLENQLTGNHLCICIYPSDANFLLVKFKQAKKLYDHLCTKGIIVRDRSRIVQLENCLRITIGTTAENKKLITEIIQFKLKQE